MSEATGIKSPHPSPLLAVDLCCGAGGWACAARGLPIRWVAVADLAADCLETWRVNHAADHPECKMLQCDLSTQDGAAAVLEAVGKTRIDIVVGGIPCEQVSTARGASKASEAEMDAWHRLIDFCLGIVFALRPGAWAIEDVLQIERHLPCPIDLGWDVPFRRLDADAFGPQRRLRTFLGRFPDPVPDPNRDARVLGDCLLAGPHQTIPRAESYERTHTGRNSGRVGSEKVRVLDADSPSWTILSSMDRGSRQRRCWMIETAGGRLRKLDWREQARVQGFPADFLFAAGLIRTEKMIGQAIDVRLGRAILTAIVEERRGEGRGAREEGTGKRGQVTGARVES